MCDHPPARHRHRRAVVAVVAHRRRSAAIRGGASRETRRPILRWRRRSPSTKRRSFRRRRPRPGSPAPLPQPGTFQTEKEKLEAALPKFLEAANKYPNSDAGIAARYHAAAMLAALGRYAEAEQRFKEVDRQGGQYDLRANGAAGTCRDADRARESTTPRSPSTRSSAATRARRFPSTAC